MLNTQVQNIKCLREQFSLIHYYSQYHIEDSQNIAWIDKPSIYRWQYYLRFVGETLLQHIAHLSYLTQFSDLCNSKNPNRMQQSISALYITQIKISSWSAKFNFNIRLQQSNRYRRKDPSNNQITILIEVHIGYIITPPTFQINDCISA